MVNVATQPSYAKAKQRVIVAWGQQIPRCSMLCMRCDHTSLMRLPWQLWWLFSGMVSYLQISLHSYGKAILQLTAYCIGLCHINIFPVVRLIFRIGLKTLFLQAWRNLYLNKIKVVWTHRCHSNNWHQHLVDVAMRQNLSLSPTSSVEISRIAEVHQVPWY